MARNLHALAVEARGDGPAGVLVLPGMAMRRACMQTSMIILYDDVRCTERTMRIQNAY